MRIDKNTADRALENDLTIHEFKSLPSIARIFSKAIWLSFFRSNRLEPGAKVPKHRLVVDQYRPDPERIKRYRDVCGFDCQPAGTLPVSFIQTLFINLLGKYITSSFFPLNPLGLIHIYQSIEWHRPVHSDEALDLSCEFKRVTRVDKGYLSDFRLTAKIKDEIVWEGTSRFLSKARSGQGKTKSNAEKEKSFKKQETIVVPADTGRRYAGVSGDYNPHHLHPVFARLFGFKSAIAHGMWSMARSVASLARAFDIRQKGRVEVSFKLPVFLPAVTALCFDRPENLHDAPQTINFELKDDKYKLPHLKGQLFIEQ